MRFPNGYGSVYKLKGNRRKPWAARKTIGYQANGQPKYAFIGYYEKRSEAMLALAQYNTTPYDILQSKATLNDIFEEFKKRRFPKISDSGKSVYNSAFKHLKPLHGRYIKELRTYELQVLIDGMETKRQSKDHVRTLLNQLFDIALELNICDKNYASFIRLEDKEKSTMHQPFTKEEISKIADSAFLNEIADIALILIYTGMRPNELLKLETENVHLEERYMVGGSKTKAGKERIIPINNKVLPFVRKRYDANQKYLIAYEGKKLPYVRFLGLWHEFMRQMEMEHLPYDCRHTFATLMDDVNANKTAIKLIMGHATGDITARYTHKSIEKLIENIDLI